MKIVTLTLNPCFDLTYYLDSFQEEDVNRVTRELLESAGKGFHVSLVLRRLGISSPAVILAGRDSIERYKRHLPADAEELNFIFADGIIRENLAICPPGRCIKVNRNGFSCGEDQIKEIISKLSELIDGDTVLVVSGSLPRGMGYAELRRITDSARSRGAKLVLDTSSLTGAETVALKPWLIKPNEHELAAMSRLPADTDVQIPAAVKNIHDEGIPNILVSLGGKGIYFSGEEGTVRAEVPKVQVLSTVGAGDSSLAGYLYGYIEGFDISGRVRCAAACGTATVTLEGTGLTTRPLMEIIMPEIRIFS